MTQLIMFATASASYICMNTNTYSTNNNINIYCSLHYSQLSNFSFVAIFHSYFLRPGPGAEGVAVVSSPL